MEGGRGVIEAKEEAITRGADEEAHTGDKEKQNKKKYIGLGWPKEYNFLKG